MPDISITGPDGSFSAYLAVPQSGNGAGVLMIQEIFGVNQDMRDHSTPARRKDISPSAPIYSGGRNPASS